jgi:hypothetical protein
LQGPAVLVSIGFMSGISLTYTLSLLGEFIQITSGFHVADSHAGRTLTDSARLLMQGCRLLEASSGHMADLKS